jgi:glycine/D-amino acid oxidase-like deaminating enzyme
VGQQNAVRAYRRGLSAIDEIESLTNELGIDCGFTRKNTLYFASQCWHQRRLKREFECRRSFGFDVTFLSREELANISSIQAAGAICSRGDAQIDPYKFTQALIGSAVSLGLRAYSNTTARRIDEQETEVIIHSDFGLVQAKQIVYATGYNSEQYLNDPKGNLNTTYAVASAPHLDILGWPDNCLIWETGRPYFYARRTDDGRAIIGGGDTAFSTDHQRDDLLERKCSRLIQRFSKLFPRVEFTPEYTWAGVFAETKDGLAYIGQPSGRTRAYFALGYGGNGITFSVIAAKLISDLIAGRPNEDANVFRFGR